MEPVVPQRISLWVLDEYIRGPGLIIHSVSRSGFRDGRPIHPQALEGENPFPPAISSPLPCPCPYHPRCRRCHTWSMPQLPQLSQLPQGRQKLSQNKDPAVEPKTYIFPPCHIPPLYSVLKLVYLGGKWHRMANTFPLSLLISNAEFLTLSWWFRINGCHNTAT